MDGILMPTIHRLMRLPVTFAQWIALRFGGAPEYIGTRLAVKDTRERIRDWPTGPLQ